VLVGHSLGGGIALLACINARASGMDGMIGRLVLIDCAAYQQELPQVMRMLRFPLLGWGILHLLPLRFMVRFTLKRLMRDPRSITPERIERYVACFGGKGTAAVFIATCRQLHPEAYAGLAGQYAALDLPTLIIWGEEDPLISVDNGRRLQAAIPASRLVIIPGCGHIPQEERPDETAAAMRDFLFFSPSH
jgi:pimeloyl-ACP methyl ester carboxylesterase